MRVTKGLILCASALSTLSCSDQSKALFEGEWVAHSDPEHPNHMNVLRIAGHTFALNDVWEGEKEAGTPLRGSWVYKDGCLVLTVQHTHSCKIAKGEVLKFRVAEVTEKTLRILDEDEHSKVEQTYTKRS